jgi:hypothetical protein
LSDRRHITEKPGVEAGVEVTGEEGIDGPPELKGISPERATIEKRRVLALRFE